VAPWFKYKFISDYIENRKVVDWLSSLFIMLRIKFKLSRTKPICQDDKIPLETLVNIKCVHQKVVEWLSSLSILSRIKFMLFKNWTYCHEDKIPLETWVNIKCDHQKVFEWLSSLVWVLYFVRETRFSTITMQTKFWGLIVVFVLSKIWMSILSGHS